MSRLTSGMRSAPSPATRVYMSSSVTVPSCPLPAARSSAESSPLDSVSLSWTTVSSVSTTRSPTSASTTSTIERVISLRSRSSTDVIVPSSSSSSACTTRSTIPLKLLSSRKLPPDRTFVTRLSRFFRKATESAFAFGCAMGVSADGTRYSLTCLLASSREMMPSAESSSHLGNQVTIRANLPSAYTASSAASRGCSSRTGDDRAPAPHERSPAQNFTLELRTGYTGRLAAVSGRAAAAGPRRLSSSSILANH
eukprot:scaffold58950_cov63-Phaeocystis_antarctica.AAC.4